ncbi:unnamed protein product [Phytophthora fragariaefolia]|uniref:Unnamed protein product n=1 Tax=Phytophthora fragariaefolia TaxID=1490495 RepID=A0A9W6Y4G2_9STRA|nr:unnamed protein product [Phytophthora fragariaefolia]
MTIAASRFPNLVGSRDDDIRVPRTAMASSDEAWISEWNLVRPPNLVTDVTAITVPPTVDKPESKRSQFGPPRLSSIPSLSSHLSYPSSVQTIQDVDNLSGPMSVAQSVSSRRTPDRESSLFGTTVAGSDESNFSSVSGSRSSGRLSLSSSSMSSFGGAEASNHMPYAGLTGVVMMGQGGVAQGGGDVGVQISDTTLSAPLVLVDQDDVTISESGHVDIRFVRLPPEEEVFVDQEVLGYLGLDSQDSEKPRGAEPDPDATRSENYLPVLTEQMTAFKRNIPMPSRMGPILGRSSYIDDIAHGAATWDQLCDDLDALLYRLRDWHILVSLPKSEFGKRMIPYLSHEIGAEGIRATPKIVKGIQDLPFPM